MRHFIDWARSEVDNLRAPRSQRIAVQTNIDFGNDVPADFDKAISRARAGGLSVVEDVASLIYSSVSEP